MLLLIAGMLLVAFAVDERVSESRAVRAVLAILGSFSLMAAIICIATVAPGPVKTSKFNVKYEIRTESLNGQEISRDTVYIFTPKEKEK